jgi:NADPH2:quinone reductase
MKAAFIEELGPPSVIQYGDLLMPEIAPQDVLVKVTAVTVDQVDTLIRSGAFETHPKFPFIIGRDMTGQVAETGRNVSRFQVGQWVWCNNQGYAGRQGTFSEYCAIHEDLLYPLPAEADPFETVAVLHSALMAVLGLQFKAGLQSGETVFVNGGDGNVGTAVLQIGKKLGAKVGVTSATEEKVEWCKALGADAVINYKTEDVAEAVRKFAPNGVNVYWDATRKPDAHRAVASDSGIVVQHCPNVGILSLPKGTCLILLSSPMYSYTHQEIRFSYGSSQRRVAGKKSVPDSSVPKNRWGVCGIWGCQGSSPYYRTGHWTPQLM